MINLYLWFKKKIEIYYFKLLLLIETVTRDLSKEEWSNWFLLIWHKEPLSTFWNAETRMSPASDIEQAPEPVPVSRSERVCRPVVRLDLWIKMWILYTVIKTLVMRFRFFMQRTLLVTCRELGISIILV